MSLTKKQETERHELQTGWIREDSTRGWHKLDYDGAVGTTRCGLVVTDGRRDRVPSAGALICALCARKLR